MAMCPQCTSSQCGTHIRSTTNVEGTALPSSGHLASIYCRGKTPAVVLHLPKMQPKKYFLTNYHPVHASLITETAVKAKIKGKKQYGKPQTSSLLGVSEV